LVNLAVDVDGEDRLFVDGADTTEYSASLEISGIDVAVSLSSPGE
jgi:hypothetical protein